MTGLTEKAIRFYMEQKLVEPKVEYQGVCFQVFTINSDFTEGNKGKGSSERRSGNRKAKDEAEKQLS